MKQILIIEDDTALANGLCRALSSNEIQTKSCDSLQESRQALKEQSCDLILLDVNLPDGNGFDFLKEIKEKTGISVILLTANDLETDIVAGLEMGADDYITKPFSLAILRARVNAALRKLEKDNTSKPFVMDGYVFDFAKMEFSCQGNQVELSKTEQKLLRILTSNVGITLNRQELIDRIWTGGAEYVDENALSVTVKRLRDKLCAGDYIKTVYGIGYVWVKHGEQG